MKITRLLTKKISKKILNQILELKDSHWKNGKKSQKLWFDQNSFDKDFHFILFINNKVAGYVHLGPRTYRFHRGTEKKYLLFRNLIIKKKFRNMGFAEKLMKNINFFVKKEKLFAFLICKKNLTEFYKKVFWSKLLKKNIKIIDHHNKFIGMVYNFPHYFKRKKIYINYNR